MMRRYVIFILVFMLTFTTSKMLAESKIKFVRISLTGKNKSTIQALGQLKLDITCQDKQQEYLEAILDENQMLKIQELGLSSEVIIEDLSAFEEQLRNSNYFDPFHSYEEMVQKMQQFQNDHPDIAMMKSLGKSWEGRDIWAIKISDNVSVEESNEAEALFMANIHAREMITPEIIIYFMHWLIDNYNIDPRATYLVNNRQLWLIPTTNPDGRVYVFTGNYSGGGQSGPITWRKNKRDNNGNNQFDSYYDGVDLNRNFGHMWGLDSGSSGQPPSDTYRGPDPFSEPESKAIKNFVESHNFVISLSYHSYGRWWIFPWGYTNINPDTPDHAQFVALAESCVAYNGYKAANGDDFSYLVSGDTDDWLYGEQTTKNKIFAFTPEVGSSAEGAFWPDTSLIPKLVNENMGPNIFMAYAAGEEPIIEHGPLTETESPGPHTITAKIKPAIPLTSPVALDKSSFKLFYRATETTPFDSISMLPTGNPDEYQAEIPCIPTADTIYYYLQASDQNGRTATLPRGASMAVFALSMGADMEPPAIEHKPIEYVSVYAQQIAINVFVFDNFGVSKVELHYRKNGGAIDTLNMAPTQVANEYQGVIIPDQLTFGDYYEYQIVAVDQSQNANETRIPEAGYLRFYVKNSIIYDFEFEASFQTITAGDWQWGIPTSGPNSAHSGSKLWATNLCGNYNDMTESILEIPEISLADKDSAKLFFWHWYQNEYSENTFWDGGNVKISVDGTSFEIVEPGDGYDGVIANFNTFLGDEPCFGGLACNGNFWHQETIDLTPYVGHSVKIRFHFASDEAVNEPGWYIDNVEIEFVALTAVEDNDLANALPADFELSQNYPNPFNPETRIKYSLAQPGDVTLEIFNLLGQKVKALVKEKQAAGNYTVSWQGNDEFNNEVTSGVYFYRLIVTGKDFDKIFVKKTVKLK